MTLIGIEEHMLTAEVGEAWQAIGLEATDPSVAFHSNAIERRLLDLGQERIALMDETGLDVQVLSLTTPALHDLGPQSIEIARRTNDALAEAVARHPGRFQAMATLPVSMPDEATLELERYIRSLGFVGTMLCGRVGADHLDHPRFAPILRCAEALRVPVLLHPRTPPQSVREAYYSGFAPDTDAALATYGLGWHYDAGIQFIRLIVAGTFDRMPGLQVILGHWGELVLFYAERLAAMDRGAGLVHPIATYLRRNLYITASGMFLPHYLERTAAIVGTERLLFSTDFPYQYRPRQDARRFLDQCGLGEAGKKAFTSDNWLRLARSIVR
uniref:Amidohydrolase family protein n=1 Tax=Bosea sp. NBC_00436 TaxID=2969620 RepID=A0A9E8CK93_9HYPH